MTFYLFLLATIVFTALGQIFFKNYFVTKKMINIALAIIFFISTPYLSYKALKGLSIDIMAILSSLIIVMVQATSIFLFKEKISLIKLFGVGLILGGLLVYYL